MASRLTLVFIRRVTSVGDAPTRVKLCSEFLASLTALERDHLLRECAELAGLRDTNAQVTLLALVEAVEVARPRATRGGRRVRMDVAVDGGPSAEPGDEDAALALDAEPLPEDPSKLRNPDWGFGRPLTLGERKNLARRPQRKIIDRALRDGHPDVVRELLVNPRLTESDVVRMCATPGVRPDVLERVFAAPRWACLPRVRKSIAANPVAPVHIALALVPLLSRGDLRELAADARLAPAIRSLALHVLRRLPPTPRGPVQIH